jgi:hypothetical protein
MKWPEAGGGGGLDLGLSKDELFARMCTWDSMNYISKSAPAIVFSLHLTVAAQQLTLLMLYTDQFVRGQRVVLTGKTLMALSMVMPVR